MPDAKRLVIVFVLALVCGGSLSAQGPSDGWLQIEVRDEQGQALGRACVTIVPRSGEIVFRKADGRGKVKLKKLAQGSYRVVVKLDGYEAQKREVMVSSGTEIVAFALPRRKF